jgi:hypothetical protein
VFVEHECFSRKALVESGTPKTLMAWKMASPLSIMLGASPSLPDLTHYVGASPGLPYQAHWCLAQHNGQTLNHASIIQELSPCLIEFLHWGRTFARHLVTIGMDYLSPNKETKWAQVNQC